MEVRRITLKNAPTFDLTVTIIKAPDVPFATFMIVQGREIVVVPLMAGAQLSRAMRQVARAFLQTGSVQFMPVVRVAGAEDMTMTITAIKDKQTPFPTIMIVQGEATLAIPLASGETLTRAMHACALEYVREVSGGAIVSTS